MKKIILTEKQVKSMTNTLIKESVDDNRYERKVEVSVGTTGQYQYKGMVLDEITTDYDQMRLTYLIEQEHRSWGIKDISLYDIKGYDDIEVTLHLYPQDSNDSDDAITKEVKIPLDWNKLNVESNQGEGVITIGNRLDITFHVVGDELIPDMSIEVYTM